MIRPTSAPTRAGVELESILAALEQFPGDVSMYPLTGRYAHAVSTCREMLKTCMPDLSLDEGGSGRWPGTSRICDT